MQVLDGVFYGVTLGGSTLGKLPHFWKTICLLHHPGNAFGKLLGVAWVAPRAILGPLPPARQPLRRRSNVAAAGRD